MKKEDQVVSLEIAKKLYEAGYRQDTEHFWAKHPVFTRGEFKVLAPLNEVEQVRMKNNGFSIEYAAPIVAELIKLMPYPYALGNCSINEP